MESRGNRDNMRKLITIMMVLFASIAMAQTQSTLPVGSVSYSGNLFIDMSGNVWTGKAGSYTNLGTWLKVDSLVNIGYTNAQIDSIASGLQSALDDKINVSEKGANNGVAPINSSGKIPSQYLDITGSNYLGTWDASTNTPSIADGTGSSGDYYRVTVAGTQDLGSGNITFVIGDDVRYNGTIWERVPSGQSVVSVNGQTGEVVIDLSVKEDVANKATSLTSPDDTKYPTTKAVSDAIAAIPVIPTGGTTGQILSKINSTNYNTQWINPPSGGGGSDLALGTRTTTTMPITNSNGTGVTLLGATEEFAGLITHESQGFFGLKTFWNGLSIANDGDNNGIRFGTSRISKSPGNRLIVKSGAELYLQGIPSLDGFGIHMTGAVRATSYAGTGNRMAAFNDTGDLIALPIPSGGGGTVTSVGLSAPIGLTVSGSPVTSSGTLALDWFSGYQGYTTAEANKLSGIAAGANNYVLPLASASGRGGVSLWSGSNQTTPPNALSYTAERTYAIQVNSSGQALVNVPWEAGSGATNLAQGTRTTTTVPITSSTGSAATLQAATTSLAGVMTSADKTKLDGIATGAQVNTVTSVAGKTGAVTLVKADVALGNVDNTSDANKPISTATQTALNGKQNALIAGTGINITGNTISTTGGGPGEEFMQFIPSDATGVAATYQIGDGSWYWIDFTVVDNNISAKVSSQYLDTGNTFYIQGVYNDATSEYHEPFSSSGIESIVYTISPSTDLLDYPIKISGVLSYDSNIPNASFEINIVALSHSSNIKNGWLVTAKSKTYLNNPEW